MTSACYLQTEGKRYTLKVSGWPRCSPLRFKRCESTDVSGKQLNHGESAQLDQTAALLCAKELEVLPVRCRVGTCGAQRLGALVTIRDRPQLLLSGSLHLSFIEMHRTQKTVLPHSVGQYLRGNPWLRRNRVSVFFSVPGSRWSPQSNTHGLTQSQGPGLGRGSVGATTR